MTMMIDWDRVAHKLGYTDEPAMWTELYAKRGLSFNKLAEQFGISRTAVRASIRRCRVPVRSRGGPNYRSDPRELVLLEKQADRDGVAAVAERLGVSPSTVYKRLYRLRDIRKAEKEEEKT